MDMLCLMFECPERGVLASSSGAWSDEEIAGAVSGNTRDVLDAINELVAKGVASRRKGDGAICSRRLVRDEQQRAADRVRQHDYRTGKRHGVVTPSVTPSVTPLSVNESEDEDVIAVQEVQFQLEKPNGDQLFERFHAIYPRPASGELPAQAFFMTVEWLSEKRKWSREDAALYLIRRAEIYRERSASWPDQSMVSGEVNWLKNHKYAEDEKFWSKGAKADAGTQAIKRAAERVAARMVGPDELDGAGRVE